MTPIAPHMSAFLRERLPLQRGASDHTCDSYAYAFQLLFQFASARLQMTPSALALEQLDAPLIMEFLHYLETARHNSPRTRNARLVAIKSFMRFLEYRVPALLEHSRRILAIPAKKTETRLVHYLTVEEMQSLLNVPDLQQRDGIRDRAMLHLCFAAGLRVSELSASSQGPGFLPDAQRARPRQRAQKAHVTALEGHGRRYTQLARGAGDTPPSAVRQCPWPPDDTLGVQIYPPQACEDGRASLCVVTKETRLTACLAAHQCHVGAASHGRYPEGGAVVGS